MIAQLQARLGEQDARLAQQDARIAAQDAEIAELRRQLAASSRNSSKPPSSDGLDRPAPKSLRGRSARQPGGQPGREGRTLRQVAVPEEVVVHEPDACAGCGGPLPADGPPTRSHGPTGPRMPPGTRGKPPTLDRRPARRPWRTADQHSSG